MTASSRPRGRVNTSAQMQSCDARGARRAAGRTTCCPKGCGQEHGHCSAPMDLKVWSWAWVSTACGSGALRTSSGRSFRTPSPFAHNPVAIAVTGAGRLGRREGRAPTRCCSERAARLLPRHRRRKRMSMPELERAAGRPPVSVGVGSVVSIGPARTTVRVCEGAHVPSISRSATASGSVAVSSHVFLMAIQSAAY